MFFRHLQGLFAGGIKAISITCNADDTMTVVVMPNGEGALAQPLALTGTATELDVEFMERASTYVGARKSLAEQMEATTAVLAAAKQESATKAAKAITKSAEASTVKDKAAPTNSDPEEGEDDEGGKTPPAPDVAPAAPAADPGNLFA